MQQDPQSQLATEPQVTQDIQESRLPSSNPPQLIGVLELAGSGHAEAQGWNKYSEVVSHPQPKNSVTGAKNVATGVEAAFQAQLR
jgi:hypothetical protein